MKRHLILLAILFLAGAFTAAARAQSAGAQKVVATIPFAFNVGNTNLPAGKYTITVLSPTSDRRVLQIRSRDGRSSAMIFTTAQVGSASDNAKLVFQRYGDRYFFSQAQMAGDSTNLTAVKSRAERTEEKHAIAAARKRNVVVVIAE